jgi:hypothetical protein
VESGPDGLTFGASRDPWSVEDSIRDTMMRTIRGRSASPGVLEEAVAAALLKHLGAASAAP